MVADGGLSKISERFRGAHGKHEPGYEPPPLRDGLMPPPPETHPGQLEATIQALTAEMREHRARLLGRARAAYPVPIPPMAYTVSNGLLVPAAGFAGSEHSGPRTGWFWDVRRITIDGLISSTGQSRSKEGSVTSPGANATITSIASPVAAGTYDVQWNVGLAGTPAAADMNNFKLAMTGVIGSAIGSDNPGQVGGPWQQNSIVITVPAGTTSSLLVQSNSAGTAGAIYIAQLTITPVADDEVTLYKRYGSPSQERLHTFTAPGTSPGPDWAPGGGCIMRPGDALQLAADVPLAAAQVVLSGEGYAINSPFIGEYLL